MKTIIFAIFALLGFAANSVLCRIALSNAEVNPIHFTQWRLMAGMFVLLPFIRFKKFHTAVLSLQSVLSGFLLFGYAVSFSMAYVSLGAGTGALVLFTSVQFGMLVWALIHGERLTSRELLGYAIAIIGFIYLVLPDLAKPSLYGFMLMMLSGLCWAAYTVMGQASRNPMQSSGLSFLLSMPWVLLTIVFFGWPFTLSIEPTLLAIASGAITSGMCYALWYQVLPKLSIRVAATSQLSVPVLASLGGVIFLGEIFTSTMIISSVLVLAGLLLVVWASKNQTN